MIGRDDLPDTNDLDRKDEKQEDVLTDQVSTRTDQEAGRGGQEGLVHGATPEPYSSQTKQQAIRMSEREEDDLLDSISLSMKGTVNVEALAEQDIIRTCQEDVRGGQ